MYCCIKSSKHKHTIYELICSLLAYTHTHTSISANGVKRRSFHPKTILFREREIAENRCWSLGVYLLIPFPFCLYFGLCFDTPIKVVEGLRDIAFAPFVRFVYYVSAWRINYSGIFICCNDFCCIRSCVCVCVDECTMCVVFNYVTSDELTNKIACT